jgi:hypothetical protein
VNAKADSGNKPPINKKTNPAILNRKIEPNGSDFIDSNNVGLASSRAILRIDKLRARLGMISRLRRVAGDGVGSLVDMAVVSDWNLGWLIPKPVKSTKSRSKVGGKGLVAA